MIEKWLYKYFFKYYVFLMGKFCGGNYYWIDNYIVKVICFKGKFIDFVVENYGIEVFKD